MAQIGAISTACKTGVQTILLFPKDYQRTKFSVRDPLAIVPRGENKRPSGLTRKRAIKALVPDNVGACFVHPCVDGCFDTITKNDLITLRMEYYSMTTPDQGTYFLNILNNKLPDAKYVINGKPFCEKCFAMAYFTTTKHIRELKRRIRENGSRYKDVFSYLMFSMLMLIICFHISCFRY
jgi:hypothetical protein